MKVKQRGGTDGFRQGGSCEKVSSIALLESSISFSPKIHFRSPRALSLGTPAGWASGCLQHTQLRVRCWMPLNPLKLSEGNIWSSSALNPVTTWRIAGAGNDCQSEVPFLSFSHGSDGLLLQLTVSSPS